jgi:hypothetical protein
MAETLTDARLGQLHDTLKQWLDGASSRVEKFDDLLSTRLGQPTPTVADVLSLVREVQQHRDLARRPRYASTHNEVLAQAYRCLSRELGDGNTTRAESWSRVIATLTDPSGTPSPAKEKHGDFASIARSFFEYHRTAPTTSTKPGLKQETLGADAKCAEPGCTVPRGMASLYTPGWKCPHHRRQDRQEVPLGEAPAKSWAAARVEESEKGRTTISIRPDDSTGPRYGITVPLDVIRPVMPMLEVLMNGEELRPDLMPTHDQLRAFVAALTPQSDQPVYVVRPEAGPISDLERAAQVADAVASESSAMASDARGASNEALAKCYDQQIATAESVARRIRNLSPKSAPAESKAEATATHRNLHADLGTVTGAIGTLYELGTKSAASSAASAQYVAQQALGRITHGVSLLQAVADAARDVLPASSGGRQRLHDALRALDGEK